MAKKPPNAKFLPPWEHAFGDPILVHDPHAVVRGPWLGKWVVLGFTFDGFRAVGRTVHVDGLMMGVVDRVIRARDMGAYRVNTENIALQDILSGIKKEMLTHGATPLAVQWVGEVEPFTEEEYNVMAEKLKKGGAAAKPAAKPAATGGKKGGNPEALEKARAARASANADRLNDKRKLAFTDKGKAKVEKKGKDDKLARIVAAKTVGAALALEDVTYGDITYAEKTGLITIG